MRFGHLHAVGGVGVDHHSVGGKHLLNGLQAVGMGAAAAVKTVSGSGLGKAWVA